MFDVYDVRAEARWSCVCVCVWKTQTGYRRAGEHTVNKTKVIRKVL